jgi:predicted PurR-regulated permease PerM
VSDERDDLPPEDLPPPDPEPLAPEPPDPPARVAPVVIPRWVQAVALPIALLALWALARAAKPVVLVFIVAGLIALILNPLVKLAQRLRLPRGLAVFAVYIGFFLAFAGTVVLLIDPVSGQVQTLQASVPGLVDSANASLADLQDWLDERGVDVQVRRQGQTALQTLQDKLLTGSGDVVSFTSDILTRLVEAAFALVLVLVISIYMLLYGERIGARVRALMPPGDGTPQDDYPTRVQKAVFGYVRGQLLFSLLMGLGAGLGLWIFGVAGIFPDGRRYALAFGVFFGLMEMIPYIGPFLGATPPMLVALFQDPLMAVWVALLFVGLQQVEGHIVAPQVFGHSLRINPLLVIFTLLVGGALYGIIGALVALPLAAVIRETVVYMRSHAVLEPWGTPSAQAIAAARAGPRATTACPECGGPAEEGDAFCRTCGTGLHPRQDVAPTDAEVEGAVAAPAPGTRG